MSKLARIIFHAYHARHAGPRDPARASNKEGAVLRELLGEAGAGAGGEGGRHGLRAAEVDAGGADGAGVSGGDHAAPQERGPSVRRGGGRLEGKALAHPFFRTGCTCSAHPLTSIPPTCGCSPRQPLYPPYRPLWVIFGASHSCRGAEHRGPCLARASILSPLAPCVHVTPLTPPPE